MAVDDQVLKDVNTHITDTFLNEGLERKGEAESTEDGNQEYQINKFGLIAFILALLQHLKICPLT